MMFGIYIPSSTAFRVHIRILCIYSKKEISADWNEKMKCFSAGMKGNETGAMNEWKSISFIHGSWSGFPMASACNTSMQLAATSGGYTLIKKEQTRLVFSELGALLLYWFIATAPQSFKGISIWSLIYFVQCPMTCWLPLLLTLKLVIAMQRVLSAWMIKLNSMCHFLFSRVLLHLPRSIVIQHLHQALPWSGHQFLAGIGTWAFVTPLAWMGAGMGFSVSVKANTEQRTNLSATLSSKFTKKRSLWRLPREQQKGLGPSTWGWSESWILHS